MAFTLLFTLGTITMETGSGETKSLVQASLTDIPKDVQKIICRNLANLTDIETLRKLSWASSAYHRLISEPRFLEEILQSIQQKLPLQPLTPKEEELYKISPVQEAQSQQMVLCAREVQSMSQLRTTATLTRLKNALKSSRCMQIGAQLFFCRTTIETHPLLWRKNVISQPGDIKKHTTEIQKFLKKKRANLHFMLDAGMNPNLPFGHFSTPLFIETFFNEYMELFSKFELKSPDIFDLFLKYGADINHAYLPNTTLLDNLYNNSHIQAIDRDHFIAMLKKRGARSARSTCNCM